MRVQSRAISLPPVPRQAASAESSGPIIPVESASLKHMVGRAGTIAVGGLVGAALGPTWGGCAGAGLGFLVGSVPKDDGWGFDGQGALGSAVAAGLVGAGAGLLTSGSLVPGLAALGIGLAAGGIQLWSDYQAAPKDGYHLADGVNRFQGESKRAAFKGAKRAYYNAGFSNGSGHYASRGQDWDFGKAGPSGEFIGMLRDSAENAEYDLFDILVMLTGSLPSTGEDPAVVVVRGADQLRRIEWGADSLKIPTGETVPYSKIHASVGYAWR